LCAYPEKSVAATKSYIATLTASARLVAHWTNNNALLASLVSLPEQLLQATSLDWSPAIEALKNADRAIVIGRGLGMAVALEAALKLKETCAIQAEAFSSAEVKHGPMALIGADYPVLIFAPKGPEQAGLVALATDLASRGAKVLLAAPDDIPERNLPLVSADHEALNPLLVIQSFYLMAGKLSEARGMNPDEPKYLSKITRTL
jgi:glucosamine--fructose-6-phosphate aminotransferase (isomerizing)